jgi:hypothetical protein
MTDKTPADLQEAIGDFDMAQDYWANGENFVPHASTCKIIDQLLEAARHAAPAGEGPTYGEMDESGVGLDTPAFLRHKRPSTPAPAESELRELDKYQPGTWFQAKTIEEMSAFYFSRLDEIKLAAREVGYAIGVHGSARRDFDLIAMPWRENPGTKDELAKAVAHAACGITSETYQWEQKPAGRYAVSIPICWTAWHDMISAGHIDLSVIEARPHLERQAAGEEFAKGSDEYYDADSLNPEQRTFYNSIIVPAMLAAKTWARGDVQYNAAKIGANRAIIRLIKDNRIQAPTQGAAVDVEALKHFRVFYHRSRYENDNATVLNWGIGWNDCIDWLAEQGHLPAPSSEKGKRFRIEHDGFQGTVIGHYTRLDGEEGVVMQQNGTTVVHVYRKKWLIPVEHPTEQKGGSE